MEVKITKKFINIAEAIKELRKISWSFSDVTGWSKENNQLPKTMDELIDLLTQNVFETEGEECSPDMTVEITGTHKCVEYETMSGKNGFNFYENRKSKEVDVLWVVETTKGSSLFSAKEKGWKIILEEKFKISPFSEDAKRDTHKTVNAYNEINQFQVKTSNDLKLALIYNWEKQELYIKSLIHKEGFGFSLLRKEIIIDILDKKIKNIKMEEVIKKIGEYLNE